MECTPAGSGQLDMDKLTYHYYAHSNKLERVTDQVNAANYSVDIDDQPVNNYVYDYIGNLVRDTTEHIDTIRWTVYGKINRIVKLSGDVVIDYGYDPGGNRTSKKVNTNDTVTTTYYVRDAQGNVMAIYSKKEEENIKWDEQHLYGSSRLGIWQWDAEAPASPPVADEDPVYDSMMLGSRTYELSNHLGNVLSTISDKKTGNDSSGVVNYYIAEVLSQNDYYPFGMMMPGRKYSVTGSYRYGFNGKENDNDVKGEGNSLDFGARIYDGRVGKWLSVDPLQNKYPGLTPYHFTMNNPILFIDPTGKDVELKDHSGTTVAIIKTDGKIVATRGMENCYAIQSYQKGRDYLAGKSTSITSLEQNRKNTIIQVTDNDVPGGASFTAKGGVFVDQNGNSTMDLNEVNSYVPDSRTNGTILWNPKTGLLDAEGNYHSPALVLDHEAKHAAHNQTDAKQYERDVRTITTDGTDNIEEKKAIDETNTTSRNLKNEDGGNGKRTTHGGQAKKMMGIDWNRPIDDLNTKPTKYERKDNTSNGSHPNGNGGGY